MSRVGKNPVAIPAGVNVEVSSGKLSAKGKLGSLSMGLSSDVTVKVENGQVLVQPVGASKRARMMWGTTRNLVRNMVNGVANGYSKALEINGVGYRAAVQGKELVLQLGFSHEIKYPIPEGITVKAEKPTALTISGANRQKVGQVAAEIRSFRGPEPYKGKGIKYESETILRKEGKKK
ncbi:MAG: 50S ribosomal protein L6 [Alphaproteobacteria bacterium]|nr:50S ribosomal protein L6 [Alphaproteobacteria bacterium]